MTDLDYGAFDALTFDCYGTLIDWEAGILAALRTVLPADDTSDDALLEEYANAEATIEAGPYRRYREIAGEGMAAVARAHGATPTAVDVERLGADNVPKERILHVAQSLFHDHAPAQRLGFRSVWIDRRHDRPGAGATPPTDARPDATFPAMAAFAAAAVPD